MTFKQGLISARSHLVLIAGLLSATGLVIWLEGAKIADVAALPESVIEPSDRIVLATPQTLSAEELNWAKVAWKYFENNTIAETGMVNSVDQYNASTLWDTSSYLMAVIAAQRLGIISINELDARVDKLLQSLAKMPLFENSLPNKSYNTISLQMVDYTNQPTPKGIGWSAIDIGRILVPFNILTWHYPQHTPAINQVLNRWNTKPLLLNGALQGATVTDKGEIVHVQEGRLGYEEYAAKSFTLLGLDVANAARYTDYLKFEKIYGIDIATDSRDPIIYQAHNYVVSEPYILDGIEFGWDHLSKELAWRIYQVQQARFQHTHILTAVSEDNIDQAPYFVYNTIYTDGKAWNAITEKGEDASQFKTLSTKAAFGWYALYNTDYTRQLMLSVKDLAEPNKGWYSGRYELTGQPNKALTANTNGIILETLAYKQWGKLVKLGK